MEIVPFRSTGQNGVNNNSLNTCWNGFTKHLLALSEASGIVLVGNTVLDCFTSKFAPNAMETLRGRNIYRCTIGYKDRLVVKADFDMGRFVRFASFFDGIMFDSKNQITVIPGTSECYR